MNIRELEKLRDLLMDGRPNDLAEAKHIIQCQLEKQYTGWTLEAAMGVTRVIDELIEQSNN